MAEAELERFEQIELVGKVGQCVHDEATKKNRSPSRRPSCDWGEKKKKRKKKGKEKVGMFPSLLTTCQKYKRNLQGKNSQAA